MEGKTLSGQFPASGFQKLARLVEAEGEPFQLHILDLLQEVVSDPEMHSGIMAGLRQKLTDKDIDDFLKFMPPAAGYAARTGHMQEILKITGELKASHVSESDLAHLMASELIHRKRWEKTMEENPGTLQALKNRLV